jgi:hypothetical protein
MGHRMGAGGRANGAANFNLNPRQHIADRFAHRSVSSAPGWAAQVSAFFGRTFCTPLPVE